MPDKSVGVIDLKGSALVFTPSGETAVYKVEISTIAAGGDYHYVECFANGAWEVCELLRSEHEFMMGWVEFNASRLAPTEYQWWKNRLATVPSGSQAERLTFLVEQILRKFDITREALVKRLGMTRNTLYDYCKGRGKGSGATLELALEALLARPTFDAPAGDDE